MRILLSVTAFIVILISSCCNTDGVATVTYQVTFESTWSASTHPYEFPPSPHFSGLIGTTHNNSFEVWEEGDLATPGIKSMAETGSKNPLNSEIDEAIEGGVAYSKLSGGGISSSPGTVNLTFEIHKNYPLVSLVSMIAPSPDWFVGVTSLNLIKDGQWIDNQVVDLYAYDAGTDSGVSYTSPNSATNPPQEIYKIETAHFFVDETLQPLGTFTFTKQ